MRFAIQLGSALALLLIGCDRSDSAPARDPSLDSVSVPELDRPVWTNQLRIRMDWVPSLGRDPAKTTAESTSVVQAGLDSAAKTMARWSTLSLVRLHGEMGWTCRGCGHVMNDPLARIALDSMGTEKIIQVRPPDGAPVAWMTIDTSTRQSFLFYIDREFQRQSDSSTNAFRDRIRQTGLNYVRRQNAGIPQPRTRKDVLPEVELMGQFSHFSTRVVDLELDDYLDRLDTPSIDSVRYSEIVSKAKLRSIQPEELNVLGLAANIGITSKSCYRRISNGDISFRTRRTGSWRVTSAWNPQGKPVAWNALDTASTFQFPIWFHLDRQACLEQTDSVASRPSLFRRIFHLQ